VAVKKQGSRGMAAIFLRVASRLCATASVLRERLGATVSTFERLGVVHVSIRMAVSGRWRDVASGLQHHDRHLQIQDHNQVQ